MIHGFAPTIVRRIAAGVLIWVGCSVANGQIFVVSNGFQSIGEYDTSGSALNATLIAGLSGPVGLAVSGNNLFVANYNFGGTGSIGEYTTTGATVNSSLITGVDGVYSLAASGSDLYASNTDTGTIGRYTTAGATVNASFISGLTAPIGLAISNGSLYVLDAINGAAGSGKIFKFDASLGGVAGTPLVTGLTAYGLALVVSGNNLFVGNETSSQIDKYDATTGALLNAAFISGVSNPRGLVVSGSSLFVGGYG